MTGIPASLWCSTLGLVLDASGAIFILWPFLWVSQADVLMGGVKPFWAAGTVEEARRDPLTWATLRQVRGLKWGRVSWCWGRCFSWPPQSLSQAQ